MRQGGFSGTTWARAVAGVVMATVVTTSTAAVAQKRPRPAAATAKGPDAAKKLQTRAEEAKNAGNMEEALRSYADAVSADPNDTKIAAEYGRTLYQAGKFQDAAEQFKKLTSFDNVAWYNLAYALRKSGDYQGAVDAYKAYVKEYPDDADGYYNLAECYRKLGKGPEAAEQFEQYAQKETRPTEQSWVEKAKSRATVLRAGGTVSVNAPVAAAAPAPAPVVAAPVVAAPAPAPIVAAPVVAAPAPVVEATPAPVEPAPVSAPVSAPVVSAPVVSAPAPDAVRARDPAAAYAKIQEGDVLFKQKRFREALFSYQDAVKLDDQSTNALLKMGLAYANQNYFQEAIDAWQKVLQINPKDQYAPRYITAAKPKLAQAAPAGPQPLQQSPVAGAAPAGGNTVVATAPVSPESEAAAKDAYRRAVQLINSSRYQESLAELNTAIEKNPAYANAYVARGGAYLGLRNYAEAVSDYQKALTINANMATPQFGLGRAYERLGQKASACDAYKKYSASTAPDAQATLRKQADAQATALCSAQ